jgi:hypothetical protein
MFIAHARARSSADPDPTGVVGVVDLLPKKTVVNIPG